MDIDTEHGMAQRGEAVLYVNAEMLADERQVGINAVRADHQDRGRFYTVPLYLAPPPAVPEGMVLDAERLDWLAHHSVSIRQDYRDEWFLVGAYYMKNPIVNDHKRFGSAREAIDAAMLAAAQQEGTT